MAGVSTRFKAMFEEDLDRKVFVVPLVDYHNLKKIVMWFYKNIQVRIDVNMHELDFLERFSL